MAKATARKRQEREQPADERHLKAIPGGRNQTREPSGVGELLSGQIPRAPKKPRARKREIPPQELPRNMEKISNLFAAARTLKKEVETKERWAKGRIDEFCVRDFVRRFAAADRRPPSIEYTTAHSKFKFVLTSRTTLTGDKEDALRDMSIPLEEYTQLAGVEINYDAIRQHGLENSLREALEAMDIRKSILDECFRPKVELKDAFYDRLAGVVRGSLQSDEKLEEKMFEVLQVLQPAEQVRNVDVIGLDSQQCFDLVRKTEIEPEEEIA